MKILCLYVYAEKNVNDDGNPLSQRQYSPERRLCTLAQMNLDYMCSPQLYKYHLQHFFKALAAFCIYCLELTLLVECEVSLKI